PERNGIEHRRSAHRPRDPLLQVSWSKSHTIHLLLTPRRMGRIASVRMGWARQRQCWAGHRGALAPDALARALRQLQLERTVNRAGYVSVQRFSLYAERGLARQRVSV